MSSELIQEFEEQGGFYAGTGHSSYQAWLECELVSARGCISKLQHHAIAKNYAMKNFEDIADLYMFVADDRDNRDFISKMGQY